MIVMPRVKGFVCTTAHPEGCREHVMEQLKYVNAQPALKGAKNVLIIGASTGYGLASRIVSMAGLKANTLGIFYEKAASEKRTASAGWYNTVAFEKQAAELDIYAKSINGDAFSKEIKDAAIKTIKADMGKVDLIIYSLASPRRVDPVTGEKYTSVLKPIGNPYTNKSIDIMSGSVTNVTIEPASDEEILHTTKVMGGEDWELWIDALLEADVLSNQVQTLAYSYIGPDVTKAIYREGTIGVAKEHLEKTAANISRKLDGLGGKGYVVVAKALVTQASAAIPIVPLYIAALYKIMKLNKTHEGCIEQIYRLFNDFVFFDATKHTNDMIFPDELGRIRIDDREMEPGVQKAALELFEKVTTENVKDVLNLKDYQEEFYKLFGFGFTGIDYEQDVDIQLMIPSIEE